MPRPLDPGAALELNAAIAEHKAGRLDRAEALYRKVLAKSPGQPHCLHWLGVIAGIKGFYGEAVRLIREALAASPNLADAHGNLAHALYQLGRFEEALPHYRYALNAQPDSIKAHLALTECLNRVGDMKGLLQNCKRTVERAPNDARALLELAHAQILLGRWEEGANSARRALEIQPDSVEALWRLVQIAHQGDSNTPDIRLLGELARRQDLSITDRITAEFSLAKALDDAGLFDDAFTHCARANGLVKQERAAAGERFDIEKVRSVVDDIIARFTPDFFKSVADWGDRSELPVFVLGMPRSGTTLVEQIAASHSRVFGAGELRYLMMIADEVSPARGAVCSRDAVRRQAKAHLAKLRDLGKRADRVIDKQPDNIFILGVIAMLFPHARVVFCRRDPRDIALSCFFQRFNEGYLFAYDLADCARRYRETERLVTHWHSVLPLRMFDLQYERLVADLEQESRRLIAFLGLEWEPACLEFYSNTRPVKTNSFWQVRQPLYRRSVGRWQKYQRHLGPLFDALAEDRTA